MNKDLRAKQHHEDGNTHSLPSAVDREIDAALVWYCTEPRAGLEDRILANLRIDRERTSAHNWWHWAAAPALATLLLVASIVLWTSTHPTQHEAAQPLQTTHDQTHNRIPAATATSPATIQIPILQTTFEKNKRTTHSSRHTFAARPKLAQFPSLQPLNEQERLLIRFVEEFPQEAALIATAQVESEKKLEQLNGSRPSETNPDQQDQQER